MTEMNKNTNIPDWKLERFILKELDEAEMERIRRIAESDKSLQTRIEALERSNREILDKHPPAWMNQRIQEKLGKTADDTARLKPGRRFQIPRIALVPVGLAAIVVLILSVQPIIFPAGDPTDSETIRTKGAGQYLRLHRQIEGGSQELQSGDAAAQHDLILVQYQVDDPAYGAILSVDGQGAITTYLPNDGSQAEKIEPERLMSLDYACELDDAPRWEIFFLITSASPFPLDGVIKVLEQSPLVTKPGEVENIDEDVLPVLDLPDDFRVTAFTLLKDSPHEK